MTMMWFPSWKVVLTCYWCVVAYIQSKFKCLNFRPFMQCYKRGEKGPINSALSDIKKIVGSGLTILSNYLFVFNT
jgi:hypothetical protein